MHDRKAIMEVAESIAGLYRFRITTFPPLAIRVLLLFEKNSRSRPHPQSDRRNSAGSQLLHAPWLTLKPKDSRWTKRLQNPRNAVCNCPSALSC